MGSDSKRSRCWRLIAALVAVTFGASATWVIMPVGTAVATGGVVSDSFDGSALSSVWSVVDPVGDGSVGVDGAGSLVLSVPAGSRHVVWGANDSVRAMQAAANVDFEVELAFGSVPSSEYQVQGLLVEQDADDWLRFDFHATSTKLRVFGASTVGGSSSMQFQKTIPVPSSGELLMRVSRVGDVWSMERSSDGVVWYAAGSFSRALNVTGVGPFVSNSGSDPGFSAVLDEFRVLGSAPAYGLSVSTAGSGSGSVSRSPAGSSFPAGTEVSLTATPNAGSVFAGWSGDVVSSSPSITVTMDADVAVVATFEPDASDTTAPVITGVVVSGVSDSSATIGWVTDEPSTSLVSFGPTVAYESGSAGDGALVTSHSVTLTGLVAGSTYHFQVSSVDAAGNGAASADATFTTTTAPTGAPIIDIWYGSTQQAGVAGRPQRWYNVLGTVSDGDGITSLTYSLNGGAPAPLEMGPDLRRLPGDGDFNVQLVFDDLVVGDNSVVVTAVDVHGLTSSATVTVQLASGPAPGLPFTTDFGSAGSLLDRATVVDGPWRITADGKVTVDALAYDRTLAIGDMSWSDYEVQFDVTVHEFGTEYQTPESGYAAAIGLGLRWIGHSREGSEQLNRGWYPAGAFLMHKWFNGAGWWLRGNNNQPYAKDGKFAPQLGITYTIKARVETVAGGTSYRVKIWQAGTTEPTAWRLSIVDDDSPAAGGVLLIAHHVKAEFGDVTVSALP